MTDLWPWLAFALLGAFHGVNPAMGWLFAVALGLQEGSRRGVLRALPPIALGHAAGVAAVATAAAALHALLDPDSLRPGAAGLLAAFGAWRLARRMRHRTRAGMRAGFADLLLWSSLASTAHGAGLMLL
ncbi:MAG TPA: hypothetical protein VNM66_03020, partial [Thermodesulfobacteriota bacterium]|nr:hypothetical protein [Thermodesulfobacteriota bacterium]